MKKYWIAVTLCACASGVAQPVVAQSLGDLAKQEAARRQAASKGKVFTNGDLKPAPPPSPGAAPAPSSGTTLPPPPSLEKAAGEKGADTASDKPSVDKAPGGKSTAPVEASSTEKKDEKYWRQRAATTRDNLARAQTFQDALQARIAALSTDFVNRDDPSQRAQVALDRQKALAELERVKKDIQQYQTDLTTIADEARRAGVPAGWVR